jgi:peptidylprolyl isomerase
MKKLAIAFLSATLLSSSAFGSSNKVIASYSGGNVTESQVMEQFKPMLAMQPENKDKKFSELDKNIQEVLVRGYINAKLFEKEAEKLSIRNSQEFKDKIKNIEQQMIQQELIESKLKEKITDAMIDEEYKNLVTSLKGQEEIKTSHILLDTEEKAKEVKKKLNKGSKFADLAKEFSKDEGSKANSGEIGYTMKGQLVPEYENKAFAMKKNEISDPVKSQFGWHVIKMLDKRAVKTPTKEQAMQGIRAKLSREVVEKYMEELSANANIELKL